MQNDRNDETINTISKTLGDLAKIVQNLVERVNYISDYIYENKFNKTRSTAMIYGFGQWLCSEKQRYVLPRVI